MGSHSKLLAAACAYGAAVICIPVLVKTYKSRQRKADSSQDDSAKNIIRYEFGGPVGACGIMIGLPAMIYFLYYACGKDCRIPGVDFRRLTDVKLPQLEELLSKRAIGICAGWFGFQVLLERTLPAKIVEGVDLAPAGGSGRLQYRMNAHLSFWVSMAGLALIGSGAFGGRPGENLAVLYDEFPALASASILLSTGLSVYLYATSFAPGALLAAGGNSGNPVYDFFIGRELNPRIGSFDLKEFCELRPGLMGWMALNLGMMCKQYCVHGYVSGGMLLVVALEGLYVWDALSHEQSILSTMDITTDGFGFMLAFGDLAWVPFTYGVQARYLVDHDPGLPTWMLATAGGLGLAGYVIFRASNSEKDQFRRDPTHKSVKHLKVMEVRNLLADRPSQLLVSGWWGMARKINYTGDWLMSWAWCMPTGCPVTRHGSILTYFYPIYFAALLITRAGRDDHFCSEKYGDGWKEYKKRVPYIFVPYVI